MPIGNIGKPNIGAKLKTGFQAMTLTKAGAKKPNTVGEIATNSQLVKARGSKGHGGGNPVKRKKKAMY